MVHATKKYMVEAFGTAVLVLMGCGSAVIAGSTVGNLGVAFAFGLSVVAMAYAIGHISGCHINPAVTVGMCASGRMKWSEGVCHIVAQCVGAVGGAALLAYISTGMIMGATHLGQNVVADGYTMTQAFVAELVATVIFVRVVLGSTSSQSGAGPLAGLAIGLTLVLIHIVFIPVTGTSVNPARSFGPALLVGGAAWSQLWLFWVAPLLGGFIGAMAQKWCEAKK
jgi:aquaporin Z